MSRELAIDMTAGLVGQGGKDVFNLRSAPALGTATAVRLAMATRR